MALANKTITDLNTLSSTTISDNDLFLFVDLKSNESKNIAASEFAQYNITSSGILTTLVSGSFTGSFTGSLNGLIQSSSYASTSSLSLTSSYLFYNGLDNGTASYSVNSKESNCSISSSYALSSSYSSTSSYALTSSFTIGLTSTGSTKSILTNTWADYAENSILSNTSSYIKFNGQNNGTVYRSIVTETSNYCLTASNLQDDNTTTVARSITSSFAQNSLTASYIVSSSFSNFSETSSLSSNSVFSFVRFRLQSAGTIGKFEIIPESWYNISNIGMSPNPLVGADTFDIQFDIKYKDFAKPSVYNKNACVTNFKPVVISNVEFGNLKELQASSQSGESSENNVYLPYYFSFNGYSCTDSGFVIKFTYVTLDADNETSIPGSGPGGDQIRARTFSPPGFYKKNEPVSVTDSLLDGSIFTVMVYIDPQGIEVSIPPYTENAGKNGFINSSQPCSNS